MAFGLINETATYQRLMEECFDDIHLYICFVYLDDLIIFSKLMKGMYMFPSNFFSDLCKEVNLKLSPKKFKFFKKSSMSESGQ